MGRRHQSSRRRSYGRRQHEVHERAYRQHNPLAVEIDLQLEHDDPSAQPDPFAFLDPRQPRLRYAVGE
jgi:hypothetical protein